MITKQLNHLRYLFSKDRIYRKKEDVQALNDVIDHFNQLKDTNLKRQILFTKLFINEFLKQGMAGRNGKDALIEIERLLSIPLSEYYAKMKTEAPLLRFERLSEQKGLIPLYEVKNGKIRVNNSEEREQHNKRLFEKYQREFTSALSEEWSEEKLRKFLDTTMHELILKYIKHD